MHRASHPVHVTLRVHEKIPSLRTEKLFKVVRQSIMATNLSTCPRLGGDRFRIVHFSVQANHIHLVTEAEGEVELSAGMTSFATRAARAINRALGRSGSVWADRYHSRPMTTPRDVKNTLVYVLMNYAKHHASHAAGGRASNKDRRAKHSPNASADSLEWFLAHYAAEIHRATFGVDPCSSAPYFNGFAREADDEYRYIWATKEPSPVHAGRTWLLTMGWRRHGLIKRSIPFS